MCKKYEQYNISQEEQETFVVISSPRSRSTLNGKIFPIFILALSSEFRTRAGSTEATAEDSFMGCMAEDYFPPHSVSVVVVFVAAATRRLLE